MYKAYIKRVFDMVITITILPIFLILLLIIGPLIIIEDRGPIFYKGDRLGKNGTIYKMYKFRTMKVNAPDLRNRDGSTYCAQVDPRITKIGSFLRETSLDEIPQIINVIKNEMSLIGPRPDLPEQINYYNSKEKRKLDILPGITGFNQAYYRNSVIWKDRMKHDLYYVNHISFRLDVKIILKTLEGIVKKRGIYSNSYLKNKR